MPSSDSSRDVLLEQLAAEFAQRHRDGEHPPLSEYTSRHPDLAADIRDLFPALVQLEQLKPSTDATGAAAPVAADGSRLERLGDYRILREVGRGGMGVVYEAEQESLGRHVALKVLPPSALLNATYLERFRREAKAAARLHHTNIVPVFGVGEAGGVPFYAMQFIRGEGLDRVLADVRRLRQQAGGLGPVTVASEGSIAHSLLTAQFAAPPVSDAPGSPGVERPAAPSTSGLSVSGPEAEYYRGAARIGLQAAEALAYAHRQGILHRDVKPSNLLLDTQGIVWITDFGLAKAEGADELTQTGDIVGTIRFMAPERFEGKSLPQSDVYALGLTLYEILTLRPAFDDPNRAKLIRQVVQEPPLPPRKRDSRIPRDLETVVLKCLAKDPADRYASAETLAEDLHRFLADRPIRARRASNTERMWRWCRRNPAVAGLLALVFLSLFLGTVVALAFAVRAESSARQAEQDRDRARDAEHEGRRKLFEAYLAEAKANRLSRRPGQRFETLARVRDAAALAHELGLPAERLAELRQVAVTALALPDLTPRYLGDVAENVQVEDLSDDLTQVLLWEPEAKTNVIRAVAGGKELFRLPATAHRLRASFVPDGKHIVRFNPHPNHQVEAWRVDGPRPRLIRRDHFPVTHYSYCFRPKAAVLAFAERNGQVVIWDLDRGTEIKRLPPAGGERGAVLALHPTEPLVASCCYLTLQVLLRDYRTGRIVQAIRPSWSKTMGCSSLVWHPDGRRLFVAAGDSEEVQEYAFDLSSRRLQAARLLHTPWVNGGNAIAINPAGDRLANLGTWGCPPSLLDLETGQVLFESTILKALDRFRFAADGRSLIGTYHLHRDRLSYGVFAAGDAREVRTIRLTTRAGGWERPVVHPGGRLAVIGQGNHFAFVDLATLRELGVVKRSGREYVSMAFDGKGQLYTNSFEGSFRWPVRLEGERLTVGPPERLPFHPGREAIAASADGRTVAQAQYNGYGMAPHAGGWLLTVDRPDDPLYLARNGGANAADVSRDGRWVSFGVHETMTVYDGRSGQRVWESPLPVGPPGGLEKFTPDGRWLVTSYHAFRAGDWGTSVELDRSHTSLFHDVSPDSRMVLLGTSEGYNRLVEIATGREVVRIEPPNVSTLTGHMMVFTPDGTRLLEPCPEGLRVWDLRRIRRRLAELGLDWEGAAYPPQPEGPSRPPAPLKLTVLGGNLLSHPARLREHERGLTLLRLAANPFDAQGNLDQARWLMGRNQHAAALPYLRLALLSRPRSYPARMNRGLCLMRLGRVQEAIPDFTAAARARPAD